MKPLDAQQVMKLEFTFLKRRSELLDEISQELMNSSGAEFIDNILQGIKQSNDTIDRLLVDLSLDDIRNNVDMLRALENNKAKLNNGSLFICSNCSDSISFDDLIEEPTTTCCQNCKENTFSLKKAM